VRSIERCNSGNATKNVKKIAHAVCATNSPAAVVDCDSLDALQTCRFRQMMHFSIGENVPHGTGFRPLPFSKAQ
jgi:hypothetical protein